jgi:hypothetical protein
MLGMKEINFQPTKPFQEPGNIRTYTATVNQHLPVHHPLDACYDSAVDETQLSYYPVSSW